MFKAQEVLEYVMLLAIIVLISVGFFYFYMSSINHQKTPSTFIISNFQITNFTPGTNCIISLSFQSTSNRFTANQFNILAENYTGAQFNISVTTNNFTVYATPEDTYSYSYTFMSSNTPFCNIFTPQLSSQTGEILGLLLKVNNTEELYQFSTPVKTYYS